MALMGGIQATTSSERSLPWQARMLWIGRREQHKEGIAIVSGALLSSRVMKFSELIRLLEQEGFRLIKQKGSIRYYAKAGHPHLIRVDSMARRKCRLARAMRS